jgi:hypothetical protein
MTDLAYDLYQLYQLHRLYKKAMAAIEQKGQFDIDSARFLAICNTLEHTIRRLHESKP